MDLPHHENFEIKYGYQGFEIRKNFPYRNLLKFVMEFEWKIRETLGFDEIWLQGSCLYLNDKSTREKEFEVSI
jgi:hypothetical protein